MRVRVLERPNGTIRTVIVANERQRREGESDDAFYARIFDRHVAKHGLEALTAHDVEDSTLPPNRRQRAKWRWSGSQVVVDPGIPDRGHPRQDVIDQIEAAQNVPQLREAVKRILRG